MSFSLDLQIQGLDRAMRLVDPARLPRAQRSGMDAAMLQLESEAKQSATRIIYSRPESGEPRSGLYRASLGKGHPQNIHQVSAEQGVFGSRVKHAKIIEEGSKPHVIKPKRGKVLAFKKGGKKVFATQVNHPGTKPYKVLHQAASQGKARIVRAYVQGFQKGFGGSA